MPINFLENTDEESFFERAGVRAIFIGVLGVLFFCFMLLRLSDPWLKQNALDNFKEEKLFGRVVLKALDTFNRYEPFVVIKKRKHSVNRFIWDQVAVGDSLAKVRNADDFKIIKKDTTIIITVQQYKVYVDSMYALR
jgi:hypothetical protein